MVQQRIRRRKPDGATKLMTFGEFVKDMADIGGDYTMWWMTAEGWEPEDALKTMKSRAEEFGVQFRLFWNLIAEKGYALAVGRSGSGRLNAMIGETREDNGERLTMDAFPVPWLPSIMGTTPFNRQLPELAKRLGEMPPGSIRALQLTEQIESAGNPPVRTLQSRTVPKSDVFAVYEKV